MKKRYTHYKNFDRATVIGGAVSRALSALHKTTYIKRIVRVVGVFLLTFLLLFSQTAAITYAIDDKQRDVYREKITDFDVNSCDPTDESNNGSTEPESSGASSGTQYKAVGDIPAEGKTIGASIYGGTYRDGKFIPTNKNQDPQGKNGSSDDSGIGNHDNVLAGTASYAELSTGGGSFNALGNLPNGTKLEITYKGRVVVAEKGDVGGGGGDVKGKPRAIDLWWELAQVMGFKDGLDVVTVRGVADDTPLTPINGTATEATSDENAAEGLCICSDGSIADIESSGGDKGELQMYNSGLPGANGSGRGEFILEQWAIHVLKAIAQINGVSENNTVTKQHVLGLLAFALGEGGDINNPQKYNPLNLGSWTEYVDGGSRSDGVQSFKSFDAGVTPVARQMSIGTQNRLAKVLIKQDSTAEDFLKALTYYDKYPGNKFWAGASVGRQEAYYSERISLLNQVKSGYETIAAYTIGTPNFLDQPRNSRKPELLQFKGNEMAGESGGGSFSGGGTCTPPCPPEESGDATGASTNPNDWTKLYEGANRTKVNAMAHGDLSSPKALVIHYTESSNTSDGEGQGLLDFFYSQRNGTQTGVQFSIGKDGKIYQYYPLDAMKKTYHVGAANGRAIGIEINGADGKELINNSKQFKSVVALSKYLCDYYKIPCDDPKGDITNDSASNAQGLLGHSETPGNDHHDPDTYYSGGFPHKESNVKRLSDDKPWAASDRKDSKKHGYMKKLRQAMGLNPTPGASGSSASTSSDDSDTSGKNCQDTIPLSGDVADGSRKELAAMILESKNIAWQTDKNPIQTIANGGDSVVTTPLLKLIASLGKDHKFTITSLVRAGDTGSNHSAGKAVDIGGGAGVDGQTFDYEGVDPKVVRFITSANNIQKQLGTTCGMGLPNNQYVAIMDSKDKKCTRGLDKGTGAHIHLSVGGGKGGF